MKQLAPWGCASVPALSVRLIEKNHPKPAMNRDQFLKKPLLKK